MNIIKSTNPTLNNICYKMRAHLLQKQRSVGSRQIWCSFRFILHFDGGIAKIEKGKKRERWFNKKTWYYHPIQLLHLSSLPIYQKLIVIFFSLWHAVHHKRERRSDIKYVTEIMYDAKHTRGREKTYWIILLWLFFNQHSTQIGAFWSQQIYHLSLTLSVRLSSILQLNISKKFLTVKFLRLLFH